MAEHPYIDDSPVAKLRSWILSEMLRGAGLAALFVIGIGLTLTVIWAVGLLLPEDSKNAPPPMPYSSLSYQVPAQA